MQLITFSIQEGTNRKIAKFYRYLASWKVKGDWSDICTEIKLQHVLFQMLFLHL